MKLYNLIYEGDDFDRPEIEGDDIEVGNRTKLAKDSADDQIDSLLLKFLSTARPDEEEDEAVAVDVDFVSEALYSHKLFKLIFEAPEGDTLDPAGEEEAPEGSEKIETEEESEPDKPKIDIDKFALKVANLIKNYDNILKIDMAILNRAKKFLDDNENEEHVDRFLDILQTQHDIKIKKFNRQGDDAGVDVPSGMGAYDAGSGGGAAG